MDWHKMVTVGRIIRPHGNRGQVVVAPDTDFGQERFHEGARLSVWRADALGHLTVVNSREHKGRWIVGFEGVATISDAETLRGLELRIGPDEVQPLGAGRHYVYDLVGCRVETAGGRIVGTVQDVQVDTGTPVLVVAAPAGEVLVPFAEDICRRVDVEQRTIVIEPPEGLVEMNMPRQKAEGPRHK